MIGRILLAVDGSENAHRATDIAGELAGKLSAELCIVHVLMHGRPSPELMRMMEVEHLVEQAHAVTFPETDYSPGTYVEMLSNTVDDARTARTISALGDQIVARARQRCGELGAQNVKTTVRSGDYADMIVEAAKEFSADMIVVGSRGLGSIRSTVLGSVSQKVLHHTSCSVVTVR